MNCTDSAFVSLLSQALQEIVLWSSLVNIACVVLGMMLASTARSVACLVDLAFESRRAARARAVHDFLDGATVVDFASGKAEPASAKRGFGERVQGEAAPLAKRELGEGGFTCL